ncbi:hypothetical protein MMC26_001116 [Xylographa opegraphella]|nr:hypothetical protein [Xylographa opegraphella]
MTDIEMFTYLPSLVLLLQTSLPFLELSAASTAAFPYHSYTAIGDSYAAGVGSATLITSCAPNSDCDGTCLRNTGSFGYMLNQIWQPASFQFNACSGANTSTCPAYQINSTTADFSAPDLVSLVLGGDDGQAFVSIVYNCVYIRDIPILRTESCQDATANAMMVYNGPLQANLEAAIRDAQTKNLPLNGTQKRTVLVFGYARFYNTTNPASYCEVDTDHPSPGPDGLRARINTGVLQINGIIAAAATAQGATYVDVDAGFEGHRFCDAGGDPWFINKPLTGGLATIVDDIENGIGLPPGGLPDSFGVENVADESFHPTLQGQMVYLAAMEAALGLRDVTGGGVKRAAGPGMMGFEGRALQIVGVGLVL